jgi:hypothetical protein
VRISRAVREEWAREPSFRIFENSFPFDWRRLYLDPGDWAG